MVELRKEWKRAQLDLERSLGMRRRSNRWQKMRPLLLVGIVLSAATLVWSWSGRLRSLPPGADPRVVGLRGGSQREAPGPQGTNRPPEVSLRGLRKQGSIKMGHLDFLAEAEGVHDVASALDKLNKRFDDIPVLQQPVAMLKWASKTLPEGKWAQVTSFGLSGLTILDMAAKSGVLEKMPVITIDTLHLFPETYKLIEDVKDFYDTQQIKSYRHKHTATLEEFNLKYGDKLFKGDPTLYDFVTKIEPMKRALDELHAVAWITGRRKSQGGERVFLKLFEVDPADGRLKLNPVANWVSACVCMLQHMYARCVEVLPCLLPLLLCGCSSRRCGFPFPRAHLSASRVPLPRAPLTRVVRVVRHRARFTVEKLEEERQES